MSEDHKEKLDRSEELLAKAPNQPLTDGEADDIFEAAWDGGSSDEDSEAKSSSSVTALADSRTPSDKGEPIRGTKLFAAAAALLAIGASLWFFSQGSLTGTSGVQPSSSYQGIKGSVDSPQVELIPLVGRQKGGSAEVVGRLEPGAELGPGSKVVFRYRLSDESHVALFGESSDGSVELLWRSESKMSAGESEIQSGKKALALDPDRYNGRFGLALVAADPGSIEELRRRRGRSLKQLLEGCQGCGFDTVELVAP